VAPRALRAHEPDGTRGIAASHNGPNRRNSTVRPRAPAGPNEVEQTEMLSSALVNGFWRFSVEQAERIVCHVAASAQRVQLICRLLPFVTNLEHAPRLYALVPHAADISRLQALVGELYFFNPLRPMRRWRLNLKHDFDRVVALRLQELSARDRLQREESELADTSQWQNGEAWRNASYFPLQKPPAAAGAAGKDKDAGKGGKGGKKDGKKDGGKDQDVAKAKAGPEIISIKDPSKWVPLPQDGLLELDFSTGRRPKPDTQAIGAEALLPHLQAVKDAVALILSQKPLHLPSCFGSAALRPLTQQLLPLPLTASQAVTLCLGAGFVGLVPGKSYPDLPDEGEEEEGECAPPNDVILEELRIQACLRAELLQRMFQGVIDLENLFREVSSTCGTLCSLAVLSTCASRSRMNDTWRLHYYRWQARRKWTRPHEQPEASGRRCPPLTPKRASPQGRQTCCRRQARLTSATKRSAKRHASTSA